ncbi:MAG: GNAT family N-acetyltransferase [Trebonia sp.]
MDADGLGPVHDRPRAAVAALRFRAAGPGDAAGLLTLKKDLDRETSFMLLEPGERAEDDADVAAELTSLAGAANCVVIGVLAAASGQGAGSGLLRELERWAPAHGIHRLELTVMARNHRARRLYERMGFAVEGRRRQCLLVDGRLVDELYMAKLLARPAD